MKYEKQAIVQKLDWPGNAKRMDFAWEWLQSYISQ